MKMIALFLVLVPVAVMAQQAIPQPTVANMNAAVEREANAQARYARFARKADDEGYAQVAKLFRAAALAEEILQKNHEEVLNDARISVRPPRFEGVQVGSTAANLQLAIGATNEGDELYYDFIKQARSDHAPDAERTLQYALATERAHREFFKRALARLGDNPPEDYYVGRISAETTTTMSEREPYTQVR
jgi:rubrerythrin